jgi:hypothetical protein
MRAVCVRKPSTMIFYRRIALTVTINALLALTLLLTALNAEETESILLLALALTLLLKTLLLKIALLA